jgi:hypothetical protein
MNIGAMRERDVTSHEKDTMMGCSYTVVQAQWGDVWERNSVWIRREKETGAAVALGCGREDTGKAWKQSGGNAKNEVVVRLDWVALGVEAYEVRKTCVVCAKKVQ